MVIRCSITANTCYHQGCPQRQADVYAMSITITSSYLQFENHWFLSKFRHCYHCHQHRFTTSLTLSRFILKPLECGFTKMSLQKHSVIIFSIFDNTVTQIRWRSIQIKRKSRTSETLEHVSHEKRTDQMWRVVQQNADVHCIKFQSKKIFQSKKCIDILLYKLARWVFSPGFMSGCGIIVRHTT